MPISSIDRTRCAVHFTLAALMLSGLGARPVRGDAEVHIDELINGIVSRARAVHSVKLCYTYSARVTQHDQTKHEQRLSLCLTAEGPNWRVRQENTPNFRMRRNDVHVSYYEAVGDTSKAVSRSLHLEAPQTFQDLMAEHAVYAGPRLGTFWFPSQAQFIDQHRRQTIVRGLQSLQGIEAVELEWPLVATDFDEALIVIPDAIARARRGSLRVSVAPSLGYALPSIQYVTPDGTVAQQVTAENFEDLGNELFFPRQAECATELANGQETSIFEVHDISHMNKPLPPDEFAMSIPEGTRVRDTRPGFPTSIFYLQNQDQLDDLNRALSPLEPAHTTISRRLLLANCIFLITVLSVYVFYRCKRQSSSVR